MEIAPSSIPFFKFVHLVGLIFWIGVPFAGAWVWRRSSRGKKDAKVYEELLRFEHLAFIVVLLSGWGLAEATGWAGSGAKWYETKLWLLVPVVAYELLESYHWHYKRRGHPLLWILAGPTALIVGAMIYLAIWKPGL